ncbi:MAG: sigma-70 family RNA polymerase sigma factor, partial [Burkholderiales bacterium]
VWAAAMSDPHESLAQQEQSRLLREAIAELSPHERQAIEAAFFSELTYADAAARLNEPVGTIKTRIRSGLQKLRKVLETGWES